MKSHFVSVVITAYNSSEYIVRSVKSAIQQSYKNFEIIVVDDGSTDDTSDKVRKMFPQVYLISQANGGPSAARNSGIKKSKGDLIAFLDADDYWHPKKLEQQVESARKHPEVNIFTANMMDVRKEKTLGARFDSRKVFLSNKINKGIVHNYIRNDKRYAFHPPSTMLVRKDIFEKWGLYDIQLRGSEDSEIVFRWVFDGEKIFFQNDILACCEHGNANSLTKNMKAWATDYFKCLMDAEEKYEIPSQMYPIFVKMRKKSLLRSAVLDLLLSAEFRTARMLLFRYRNKLVSLDLLMCALLSFLPVNLLRFIKRVLRP
jgi:glycosyltransferase involved in cell wall biosynthesis